LSNHKKNRPKWKWYICEFRTNDCSPCPHSIPHQADSRGEYDNGHMCGGRCMFLDIKTFCTKTQAPRMKR